MDHKYEGAPHSFTQVANSLNHFNVFYHWTKHNAFILSNFLYRYVDKGVLEIFGPTGLYKFSILLARSIENLATGFLLHYAFVNLLIIFSTFLYLLFVSASFL